MNPMMRRVSVLAIVVPLLAVGGCRCAAPPPPAATTYFVQQLYDGNLLLPGMRDDGTWTAMARPEVRPDFIKFHSGEGMGIDRWTGWGTSRAVGVGTYGNHGTRVRASAVLSDVRTCAGKRMYTRLEMDYSGTVPASISRFVPRVVRITSC